MQMTFWMKCFLYLCFLCTASSSAAQNCTVCTKNGINMPITMGLGTVRTPGFSAKRGWYNIEIEAKWRLPADELRCKMGFAVSPSDNHCKWESLLDIQWRVLDGGQVVASGTELGRSNSFGFDASKDALTRNVANFKALAHHKYIVEITFLKDASALDIVQPRLIVGQPGFSF
jgi:hypothetical protein